LNTNDEHDRTPSAPAPNDAPAQREGEGTPAYEPPRLTPIGSLRNLLGKTGPRNDTGPGPKRP
jgi:hypothetical protein